MAHNSYTLSEIAEILRIEPQRVESWLRHGLLTVIKSPDATRVEHTELLRCLAETPTTTLAGSTRGFADGRAAQAKFYFPEAVAADNDGSLLVADTRNHRIRRICTDRTVITVAGEGARGSADGSALSAQFNMPAGLAVDAAGNIYVADTGNHRIRKIGLNGQVTTLAGKGRGCADGPGARARFARPQGIAVDREGNLYIADSENHRICQLDATGEVTTLAGGVCGYRDGAGTEAQFNEPLALAIDAQGNLFIADTGNRLIRKLDTRGAVTTVAGTFQLQRHYMREEDFDDCSAPAAHFVRPGGITIDAQGNLYVSDIRAATIRKISMSGVVSTLAGGRIGYKEALGRQAWFYEPMGLAVDARGVYVADCANNRVRAIFLPDALAVQPAAPPRPSAPAIIVNSAPALVVSKIVNIACKGIKLDAEGNIYANTGREIFKITRAGEVTKIARTASYNDNLAGLAIGGDGSVYHSSTSEVYKLSPDTVKRDQYGQIIGRFNYPAGLVLDNAGNLYVASYHGHQIHKVTPAGETTVYAGSGLSGRDDGPHAQASFFQLQGLTIDAAVNLYAVDNLSVRKISAGGGVVTLAGGKDWGYADAKGTAARFKSPSDIAIDSQGNIYVTDTGAHCIRKITPDGTVSLFAGRKTKGNTDGNVKDAQFNYPVGIDIDAQGVIFVADTRNHCIRAIHMSDAPPDFPPLEVMNAAARRAVKPPKAARASRARKAVAPAASAALPEIVKVAAAPVAPAAVERRPVPPVEDYYCLALDERNNPCGIMSNDMGLMKLADEVDSAEVVRLLESGDDTSRRVTAMHLIRYIARKEPLLARRAAAALLALIPDARLYETLIEGRREAIGFIGGLAAAPYLEIVKSWGADDRLAAVWCALLAALRNNCNYKIANIVINGYVDCFFGVAVTERARAAQLIADTLAAVTADASLPAFSRITAYETIKWAIERDSYEREAFRRALQKAKAALVAAWEQGGDAQLVEYVRGKINDIDPAAIARLQEKDLLETAVLPDAIELFGDYLGEPAAEKVNAMAARIKIGQLFEALQESRDPGRVLAAIFLAPVVAKRADWQAIARALLYLIPSREQKRLGNSRDYELGKTAAEQLLVLLGDRPESDRKIVIEFLCQSIDLALDRGLSSFSCATIPLWGFDNLLYRLGEAAQQAVADTVMNCLRSPHRMPAARLLAFEYLKGSAGARAYAVNALLDSGEQPGLRAVLGTVIYRIEPGAIEALVDTSTKPWQLLPKAPTDLPICEPKDQVPIEWLAATAVAAADRYTRNHAINAIFYRLNVSPWSHEDVERAHAGIRALTAQFPRRLVEALRLAADETEERNSARTNACVFLALLGDGEDEQRVVQAVVQCGSWLRVKPFDEAWSPMTALLGSYDSNNASNGVWSYYEPYIEKGYGSARTRVIMARAFVLLGDHHLQAGRFERASRAYRWAIDLDSTNFNAWQSLKKIGGSS